MNLTLCYLSLPLDLCVVADATAIAYFQSMQTVVDFARLRPELTWDLGMLCAYSAIGQIFVFLTSAFRRAFVSCVFIAHFVLTIAPCHVVVSALQFPSLTLCSSPSSPRFGNSLPSSPPFSCLDTNSLRCNMRRSHPSLWARSFTRTTV